MILQELADSFQPDKKVLVQSIAEKGFLVNKFSAAAAAQKVNGGAALNLV